MIVYSLDGLTLDVVEWSDNQGQVIAKWKVKGKWYSITKVWDGNKVTTVNEVFMEAIEKMKSS